MSEATLQVFIDGVINYFQHTSDKDVKVGSPYLAENHRPAAFDFTGIIGVSGPYKGTVYFTAPKALLTHLLLAIGEKDTSMENILDLVGEVSNTISGNARSEFGQEFMISVPVVVEGAPSVIHLPKELRSYVIPVYWKAYSAAVVICLEH
ncbi:chemotaxis protein CheX [Halioxenophilus aromaticivorans]|uniref:Chemotaxis phosphatase CheX-like domain-containing protein n=1 Tax=Halioxenophilus aromaticivorans TaxID=1306992 RepID=A0AAV3TZX7_9ALTE